MATETGKQRSQRIQIDYYRRRTGLHRFRTFCVVVALIGAVAYAAYVAFAGGSQLSTGPLASAHASFENDCQQCHQDLTPMDSSGSKLSLSVLGIHPSETAAHIETTCQKCHQVGDHYRDAMNADWKLVDQNCSLCHADHRGRDHDLSLVSAQRCVACHADLAAGCSGTPRVRSNVTSFSQESHGDFSSLSIRDPGTVKFDHAQHLLPGQVDAETKGGFTIAQLPPQDRERYRVAGQDDSAMVTLDCSSCHEFSGQPNDGNSLIADRELGRYIQPISFDRHCAACHSLNPGLATQDSTPLPHAVPWRQVDLLLAANADGAQAMGLARQPRDDSRSIPVPGEGFGSSGRSRDVAADFDLNAARDLVREKCLQCHDETAITDESILASDVPGSEMIPSRWLRYGIYDHAAHQKIDCKYCHEAAYSTDRASGPANDHEMVMIAGIDSCTSCHRGEELATPATLDDSDTSALLGGQPTWASDHCALCHRYHTPHGERSTFSLSSFQSAASQQERSP